MIEWESLSGRWVHSHEEDDESEMVFRRADSGFTFPRARGRDSFELHPDGTYVDTGSGPPTAPSTGRAAGR